MKGNLVKCIGLIIPCWILMNGCTGHKTVVEQSGNVRMIKQRVEAEWQVIQIDNQPGLPMKQLTFDKKIWLRETDLNHKGKIDDVRIRLSSGEYIEIEDTNSDGLFHVVNQIPPDD